MGDVIGLINHLLRKQYSIDTVDSITNDLNITKDDLLQLIKNDRFKEYFQLLRSSNNRNQGTDKIALTLDVSTTKNINDEKDECFLFCKLAFLLYTLCSAM